jgi:hypothetical protein
VIRSFALAAVTLVVAGCGSTSCRTQGVPRAVERASRRVARLLNDPAARRGTYVRTMPTAAATLVGGGLGVPEVPVYLVVLEGRFHHRGRRPGRLTDFLVSVRSGRVLEIGTAGQLPPLTSLGRVHSFALAACG